MMGCLAGSHRLAQGVAGSPKGLDGLVFFCKKGGGGYGKVLGFLGGVSLW